MKVSVIATVLNERAAIESLLDSLAAQCRQADEVVIADGGSTDGTIDVLDAWRAAGRLPLKVISVPGANISAGRNAAIAAASGEVIASTDAGVRLEPEWLAALLARFEEPSGAARGGAAGRFVAVVSGWFVAEPHGAFEAAMGATVLPHVREVKEARFLPSSRSVAFRQVAWEAAGGYPEWLDFCEDLVFDMRLRDLYGAFPFAPEAVAHFRPRRSLKAFFKQYYQYARGDGKADLWRRRHAIRYLTYLVGGPALVALAVLLPRWWPLAVAALAAGVAAYLATPYRRLWSMLRSYGVVDRLKAVLWVPVIRVVGDVAKMIGYPPGLMWRWKNRTRPETHWRRPGWDRAGN